MPFQTSEPIDFDRPEDPTPTDRDVAIAGVTAAAAWLLWVLALTVMAIAPAVIISVWKALL